MTRVSGTILAKVCSQVSHIDNIWCLTSADAGVWGGERPRGIQEQGR